jgi:hypothetical protein
MGNAALRLNLAALQCNRKRPVLSCFDRLFWVALSRLWNGLRTPLFYRQADTVVRWQRERFGRFWARLSRVNQRGRGRPATAVEVRRMIERMAAANLLWRTLSQTWKTFLHNHLEVAVRMQSNWSRIGGCWINRDRREPGGGGGLGEYRWKWDGDHRDTARPAAPSGHWA